MVMHVKEPFAYDDENRVTRVFRPGDLVADDDPAVKGREHLFETADENVTRRTPAGRKAAQSRPIATAEDASAEPGRRRSLSRAKKTATKKTAAKKDQPADKETGPAKKTAAKKTAAKAEPAKGDDSK